MSPLDLDLQVSPPSSPRLDLPRVRRDLAALAAECSDLKRSLRRPWREPMGEVQRALARARLRATELHVLLAWTRGRLHVRARVGEDPRAHAARVSARVARDYARQEAS